MNQYQREYANLSQFDKDERQRKKKQRHDRAELERQMLQDYFNKNIGVLFVYNLNCNGTSKVFAGEIVKALKHSVVVRSNTGHEYKFQYSHCGTVVIHNYEKQIDEISTISVHPDYTLNSYYVEVEKVNKLNMIISELEPSPNNTTKKVYYWTGKNS